MIYSIYIALFSFFFLPFGLFYFGFKSHFEIHAIFHINWRGACAILSQCFTALQVRGLWNCMHECCLWYFPAQNFFFLLNRKIQEKKAEVWFTRSPMKADCLLLTLSQNFLMHRKSYCLLVLQKMRSEQEDWHHSDVFSYLLIDMQSFWVLTAHQMTARKFKFSKHLEINTLFILICCHCLFALKGSNYYEEVFYTQRGRWQLSSSYADAADIVLSALNHYTGAQGIASQKYLFIPVLLVPVGTLRLMSCILKFIRLLSPLLGSIKTLTFDMRKAFLVVKSRRWSVSPLRLNFHLWWSLPKSIVSS